MDSSAVGDQGYSDSEGTASARLSLAPPKSVASLCPLIDTELQPPGMQIWSWCSRW